MTRATRHPDRGAVILVALCFVAVIGISLASYLTMATQAMRLSNRGFQTDLSKQLAEAGLETALAAFSTNDWSGWTVSGSRATRTISFPASKFGPLGIVGTINLRVDNHNAFHAGSTWNSSTTYAVNDLVGRNGIWYRCIRGHSNRQPPDLEFWVPEGVGGEWNSTTTYVAEDMVNRNGSWYRATATNTNQPPPGANWTLIPAVKENTTSGVWNVQDAVVNWFGTWYRWNSGSWDSSPPISWRWRSGKSYSPNDVVCFNNVWYRCFNGTSSASPTNTSNWLPIANFWPWSSSTAYNPGDVVHRSGSWYRCLVAHTNRQPPNSAFWADTPRASPRWSATRTYAVNDVVSHSGVWYRCILGHTNQRPPNSTHWAPATTATWSPSTNYSVNAHVAYGDVWYRCLVANTGQPPSDATFWAPVGAPVVLSEGVATLPDGPALRTQLRAAVGPAPLFPNAAAATNTLTFSSGGVVDSYDSNAGAYGGTNVGFAAILAGGNTAANAVNLVGSLTVDGYVAAPPAATSPFAPLFAFNTSTTVVKGTTAVPSPKVDLSRVSRTPYIPQFDIYPVAGGTEITSISNTVLGYPGATTPSVYFYNGSLDLNSPSENIIINGPVILSISNNLRIRNNANARIRITPSGSLQLNVGRDFRIDSNGGGIVNESADPKRLNILLTRSGSDIFNYSFTGSPFYGTIYLPGSSSTITLDPNIVFFGAISAQDITFSGTTTFRYDTALRHQAIDGVDTPAVILHFRELPAAERVSL